MSHLKKKLLCIVGFVGLMPFCLLGRGALEIEQVRVREIEAKTFFRISEYFTGKENTGRRIIVRSDPAERGGIYFVMRFSEPLKRLPAASEIGVEYLDPGSMAVKQYQWVLPEDRKSTRTLFVGITDAASRQSALPVAWRIRMHGPDGRLLAERKSYLWELPEQPLAQ